MGVINENDHILTSAENRKLPRTNVDTGTDVQEVEAVVESAVPATQLAGSGQAKEVTEKKSGTARSDSPKPFTRTSRFEELRRVMPKIGSQFLDFQIVEELGHGAFGYVFLAKQQGLAGRLVALKISPDLFDETLTLARLQHTNIVPIYSTHTTHELQAVCMPYWGRVTLADFLRDIHNQPNFPQAGSFISKYLREKRTLPTDEGESALMQVFDQVTYPDAVLRIMLGLVEGLHHAHERGILHRDIKPANILLADDGQPMLLDFNLAENLHDDSVKRTGGTVPYMSPEQLEIYSGVKKILSPQSDIYSLGIVMAEMLLGRYPFATMTTSREKACDLILERKRPIDLGNMPNYLPPAIVSILQKCLEVDLTKRYQSTHQIIDDIHEHLAYRLLKYAPNTCFKERCGKWIKRHPKLTSPMSLVALGVLIIASVVTTGIVASVEKKKNEMQALRMQGDDAINIFQSQANLAEEYLTARGESNQWLEEGTKTGLSALQTVGALSEPNWLEQPKFQHLSEEQRLLIKTQAGELAFLLSTSNGERKNTAFKGERNPVVEEIAKVARESEIVTGRTPLLKAADLHASGKYRESLIPLRDYAKENPADVLGWFLLGRAAHMSGELSEALTAYSQCIALRPKFAPGYLHRSQVASLLEQMHLAKTDADLAIQLAPELPEPRLARARIYYKLRDFSNALKDMNFLIERGNPPSVVWFMSAQIREATGDKTGSKEALEKGLTSPAEDHICLVARGLARMKKEPNEAIKDFEKAAELAPETIEPLQNMAYVHAEILNQPEKAIAKLDGIIKQQPNYLPALASRAIYLARLKKFDEAKSEIQKTLKLQTIPFTIYRASCVYALSSEIHKEDQKHALRYLALSLQLGYGSQYLAIDDDLNLIRKCDDFVKLLDYVKELKRMQTP